MESRQIIKYTEEFKNKVLRELETGKFNSFGEAASNYNINGSCTIRKWAVKYGKTSLLPKVVVVDVS